MIPPKNDPMGSEENGQNHRETQITTLGGNAGGNIPSDLAELIKLWPKLPAEVRKQCLALAGGNAADLS